MAQGLTVDKDTLVKLGSEIADMDAAISAASGSGTAAKKAIREKIATEVEADAKNVTDKIGGALQKVDDRVLVGVLAQFDEMVKALKERAEAVVTAEQTAVTTEGSGNVSELKENRKGKVDQFKAIKKLLELVGADVSDVADPKRSGGGRTTGSKNKKGSYTFYMDGKQRPDSQNTFSSLAFYACKGIPEVDDKSQGPSPWLKNFLKEQGIEWPAEFSDVKLPNDRVISAVKNAEEETPAEEPAA